MRNCKKFMLLVPILVLIGILLSNINGFAEVRIYSYGRHPILFVLTSLLLGGACVCLALFFQHNRLLGVLGRNTLAILLLHKFPVVFFQSICLMVKNMLSDSCEFNRTLMALIISVVVIAMCYIAGLVIENMAPIVLGKSK